MEIAGVLSGMCIGVLVNILLIIGVNNWRRWYLLHWMIYHLVLLVMLFIVSVILFSVEASLRKLLGVVPVLASFFFIYCWIKVYELFCYLSLVSGYGGVVSTPSPCDLHAPYCVPVNFPHHPHDKEEGSEQSEEDVIVHGGMEFYPVDPLSRGMMDRLVVMNKSIQTNTYIPFHNDEDYSQVLPQ